MPEWLIYISTASLIVSALCAVWIIVDLLNGHKQHMMVMNFVWPVTALYAGLIGLWAYYRFGRVRAAAPTGSHAMHHDMGSDRPFWQSVALAASHCGAGCTLGDIFASGIMLLFPLTLFGQPVFGDWLVSYILAFTFGIFFQYFTIQPMRHLSFREGLKAALKADSLSLTSWQIGMYGWMAIAIFVIFSQDIPKTTPVYWLMMQIAMLAGFATSYPVNWFLVRVGIKEKM